MVTLLTSALFLLVLPLLPKVSSGYRSERQVAMRDTAANATVPVSLPFYDGTDALPLDDCPRDEVKLANDRCYQLLSQGPCLQTHYVVLDPITKKAYCGPRLCSPDRIFVFSKQLCYDPTDQEICQNGLQLFQTSFGTPICQCPDGTYENEDDDDQDESTCESLLASSVSCLPGQVLWFRNFSSPRECIDDPCGGQNLRRPQGQHFLVPSAVDGKCYPLGQGPGVCPVGSWYTLDLKTLKGICSRLEDAGYLVLDDMMLSELEKFYGPTIQKGHENNTSTTMNINMIHHPMIFFQNMSVNTQTSPVNNPMKSHEHSTTRPLLNAHVVKASLTQIPTSHRIITKELHRHPRLRGPERQASPRTRIELSKGNLVTEMTVRGSSPEVLDVKTFLDVGLPIYRRFGSTDVHFADTITHLLLGMPSPRKKRGSHGSKEFVHRKNRRVARKTVLPHFAPGNIFDTRLVSCRPGSERDINAKCRHTILPSRSPPINSLGVSDKNAATPAASPITPKPSCSPGQIYNLQRLCVDASAAVNSINASEIG